jgi:hypothetical protein
VCSNSVHCAHHGIDPSSKVGTTDAKSRFAPQVRHRSCLSVPCSGIHRGVVSPICGVVLPLAVLVVVVASEEAPGVGEGECEGDVELG